MVFLTQQELGIDVDIAPTHTAAPAAAPSRLAAASSAVSCSGRLEAAVGLRLCLSALLCAGSGRAAARRPALPLYGRRHSSARHAPLLPEAPPPGASAARSVYTTHIYHTMAAPCGFPPGHGRPRAALHAHAPRNPRTGPEALPSVPVAAHRAPCTHTHSPAWRGCARCEPVELPAGCGRPTRPTSQLASLTGRQAGTLAWVGPTASAAWALTSCVDLGPEWRQHCQLPEGRNRTRRRSLGS